MKGLVGGLAFLLLIPIWRDMRAEMSNGRARYLDVPFGLITAAMIGYLVAFVLTLVAIWGMR